MAIGLMKRSVQDDSVRSGPIPLPAIEITRERQPDSGRGGRLHLAGFDEFDDLLRSIANAKVGMELAGANPIRIGFSATDYATVVRAIATYLKCPYGSITRMWLAGVRAEIINDTCVGQFQLLATDGTARYLRW
ncbi:MAG: hypothetical protein IT366_17265 [Candidatus Hydrogenedentes bacterium]|nr:hypothetical protein [Candidatus Hydrogenedentota bacterium]